MVDFKKLREAKVHTKVVNPAEIFERSPKPLGMKDLYVSQSKVLEEWFKRRNEKDLVVKLPTGGGKTLVGLLIAKSLLNEHNEPVIYLASTNQLVAQIFQKANEYPFFSDSAVIYHRSSDFPDSFLSGKSILICTYNALFNSLSKFGVKGDIKEVIKPSAIILDDAHVAFSTVRNSFTITIDRQPGNLEDYQYITNLFRNTFSNLGRLGTFDDVVKGTEQNIVLDVPYWDWLQQSEQVRQYLSNKQEKFRFVWAFLRDNFDYCYCLISSKAVAITPLFPLVDMIPTFADCPRRIFMSATINDDSAIVRTFDANRESVEKPIASESSVGVGERMILVPEWMNFDFKEKEYVPKILRDLAKSISQKHKLGTVILVPSDTASKEWKDIATLADSTDKVAAWVKKLQEGSSYGPVVFANRYDGIDLQGDSCRLLILDGLPRGSNEYDSYLASIFVGGFAFNSTLAQRIEQGMGRGARGTDDYCVVIITDKKLTAWLSRTANVKFLTNTTLAQFQMGEEISRDINNKNDFINTVMRCLDRDTDWMKYYAEELSAKLYDFAQIGQQNSLSISHASMERKVFKLLRNKYFDKAINTLENYWEQTNEIDLLTKGWLEQLAARIAYHFGKEDLAQRYQRSAYSNNPSLLCPKSSIVYVPLPIPSQQSKAIVDCLYEYYPRRGFISNFEEVVSHLVPEASTNQFEQALADLGILLGFVTQRPESIYKQGPDVLWLVEDNIGLIIEAKSHKQAKNHLNKEEYGQLLTSVEWFKTQYPNCQYIPISILSNSIKTKAIVIKEAKALTFNKLNELIADSRKFFEELCIYTHTKEELTLFCEQSLKKSTLYTQKFVEKYLSEFQDS